MIGAGVVGLCVAWHLQGLGHAVTLIDPDLGGAQAEGSGSTAALGLLMAQVYRRSSGRGWRLRQQSLELWQTWRLELEGRGYVLPWKAGLLQLARDGQELQAQQRLAAERQARGIPLRLLERAELEALQQHEPQSQRLPLIALEPAPFVELDEPVDLGRFSRYWRRAERKVWATWGQGPA